MENVFVGEVLPEGWEKMLGVLPNKVGPTNNRVDQGYYMGMVATEASVVACVSTETCNS